MYGEPWTGGACGIPNDEQCIKENASKISERIAFFNNTYRDAVKGSTEGNDGGYIQTGSDSFANSVKAALGGNIGGAFTNGWTAKAPTQSIIYQSAHDNLTLFDKLYASLDSVNSYTDYSKDAEKLTMIAEALTFTGQGVPFALAGEEFCRTKYGDKNSYNSLDEINKVDWSLTQTYAKSTAYYKGLLAIREAYSPFTDGSKTSAGRMYFCHTSIPSGCIAFTIDNKTVNASKEWDKVGVLVNTTSSKKSIKLEGYETMPENWVVIANSEKAGLEKLSEVNSSTVTVEPMSAMILVDKQSFERAAVKDDKIIKITVKHVNTEDQSVLKTTENIYREGDTYRLLPDNDLSFYYEYTGTSDKTTGVAENNDLTVTFNYKPVDTFRGTVTINYVDSNGQKVKNQKVIKTAEGEYYYYSPAKVQGYSLNTSKLPANTAGIFGKENVVLNFYYKELETQNITVHYYNDSGWKRMYFYCYTNDGTEPLRAWPGTKIKTKDDDGWYTKTVEGVSEAKFCFNDGENKQDPAANIAGYAASGEVWIKDGKTTFNTTIITTYVDTTGKNLDSDSIKTLEKIDDSTKYATSPKQFDGYDSVIVPPNAQGYCVPGTINVVYLYSKQDLPLDHDTDIVYGSDTVITKEDTDSSGDIDRLVGDVNNDNTITLMDVTAIQKFAADLLTLDELSSKAADVTGDNTVNLLDAVMIQRYLAELISGFDAGKFVNTSGQSTDTSAPVQNTDTADVNSDTNTTDELPESDLNSDVLSDIDTSDSNDDTESEEETIVRLYFSNNLYWESVYVYLWDYQTSDNNANWPGVSMNYFKQNEYGEDMYYVDVDLSEFNRMIISNGKDEQTINIDISKVKNNTGYYLGDKDGANYSVISYIYS